MIGQVTSRNEENPFKIVGARVATPFPSLSVSLLESVAQGQVTPL